MKVVKFEYIKISDFESVVNFLEWKPKVFISCDSRRFSDKKKEKKKIIHCLNKD